ncbi:MAG: hypothetical protein U0Q12_12405 [Vicinamibacterales bacterium]
MMGLVDPRVSDVGSGGAAALDVHAASSSPTTVDGTPLLEKRHAVWLNPTKIPRFDARIALPRVPSPVVTHHGPSTPPPSTTDAGVEGDRDGGPPGRGRRISEWLRLAVVVLGLALVAPILTRLGSAAPGSDTTPGYLPALDGERAREVPFDPGPLEDLHRLLPKWVFIGDSMLGTRIEPDLLSTMSRQEGVAILAQAGSGSAWWYLAMKNWVVASGVHPRYVFVFFRDENLTDPLFRATGTYRWSLDRVAHEQEPDLNDVFAAQATGTWFRVHQRIDRRFALDRLSRWADRGLHRRVAEWIDDRPASLRPLEERVNALFGLDALRPFTAADMQKTDDARLDFGREVGRSVLPAMVKLAERGGFTLVFVRVQRRPGADGRPEETPTLRRYVDELRHWAETHGAVFHDDTGEPAMTLSLYGDGDHIDDSARAFYTEWFRRKLARLFE